MLCFPTGNKLQILVSVKQFCTRQKDPQCISSVYAAKCNISMIETCQKDLDLYCKGYYHSYKYFMSGIFFRNSVTFLRKTFYASNTATNELLFFSTFDPEVFFIGRCLQQLLKYNFKKKKIGNFLCIIPRKLLDLQNLIVFLLPSDTVCNISFDFWQCRNL